MATTFNLLRNAELDRILRINLTGRRLLFIGGFALLFALVISGLNWNSYAAKNYYTSSQQATYAARDAYWQLTTVLFGLLFVLAPAMTALSFIQEKLRGTAIFQQMVLISPFDIAVGKYLGSGVASYFAALIILPFAFFTALMGGLNLESVFNLYLFLFIGGLSFQALALFVSAAISSPSEKGLRGGLLVGPAIGVLGAITALYWYRYFTDYRSYGYYTWRFYGVKVEGYAIILGLLIFIGLWAFAGAVRKIKAGQLIPVRPWPVWLFFASAEALLVGILWGWQPNSYYELNAYGNAPIMNLLFYIFLNWAALLVLAGSLALGRDRLREWWSAGDDPLGLFQREEIRTSFKTFLIALAVSVAGLFALWFSYHADASGLPKTLALDQIVPLALGFTFTIAASLFFIQYCAMQRFRARAWAGVGMVVAFYLLAGVTGALFKEENNTASLLNPAIYAYELTQGDEYMDRISAKYYSYDYEKAQFYNTARVDDFSDKSSLIIHGLLAEGLLALGCFGLAYLKWRKLEDEMLEEKTG